MPPRSFAPSPDEADIFNFRSPAVAQPFPRRKTLLYVLICLLWLAFGIVGRDPWKPEETVLTAVIADMAAGGMTLPPPLLDGVYTARPPLYLWLAALTAKTAAPWLPAHEGARLANALLIIAAFCLMFFVGRRVYGKRIAWLSVLLVVGAAGFMIRAHVLNFGVPAFFGMALTFCGVYLLADERRRAADILTGAGVAAAGAVFLLFAVGYLAMAAALAAVILWLLTGGGRVAAVFFALAAAVVPAVALFETLEAGPAPLAAAAARWRGASPAALAGDIVGNIRVAAWSLLPLWPLALIGLWRERGRMPEMTRFAAIACAAALAAFFIDGGGEEDLYILLAPVGFLAARALQLLPADSARVFDFFALFIIGALFCGGLWLVWGAAHFGFPALLADYLAAEFAGFSPPPPAWFKVAAAAALTIVWLLLASNFGRSNERAAVNWSCGVTLLWAVFNLLLLPYVDSGKSYRAMAAAVSARAGGDCVTVAVADKDLRAQLHYFGVTAGADCAYTLARDSGDGGGDAVWRGGRGGGKKYRLTRRF